MAIHFINKCLTIYKIHFINKCLAIKKLNLELVMYKIILEMMNIHGLDWWLILIEDMVDHFQKNLLYSIISFFNSKTTEEPF